MMQYNIFEAKTNLSKIIKTLEDKIEDVIYIARDGKAVAQITLIPNKKRTYKRIGAAKGKLDIPENFDEEELLLGEKPL